MDVKKDESMWSWYRPIDRALKSVLDVYMALAVGGLIVFGGGALLFWLLSLALGD